MYNRRDGVVTKASASQSVDLAFIFQVESYQKTLKNGIHSFLAWGSAQTGSTKTTGMEFAHWEGAPRTRQLTG